MNEHTNQSLQDAIQYKAVQVPLAEGAAAIFHACHTLSAEAGWWTDIKNNLDLKAVVNDPASRLGKALVAEKLCLTHSEVSEAMEGHRKGLKDDKLPHRPMIEVELADAVIRIADLAGALGLDLAGAMVEKMAYNAKRPDHKIENRLAEGGKSY